MAVTRDGIPVRCWSFPGNTADTAIIRTVKDDLGGWGLRRLVWVADRGFASAANRAYLTRGGGHYIHAEKLRNTNTNTNTNTEAAAALALGSPRSVETSTRSGQIRCFRCSTPRLGMIVCPSSAEVRPEAQRTARGLRRAVDPGMTFPARCRRVGCIPAS